jgi:hypothetical protein
MAVVLAGEMLELLIPLEGLSIVALIGFRPPKPSSRIASFSGTAWILPPPL